MQFIIDTNFHSFTLTVTLSYTRGQIRMSGALINTRHKHLTFYCNNLTDILILKRNIFPYTYIL
jgi:hypothetical protein